MTENTESEQLQQRADEIESIINKGMTPILVGEPGEHRIRAVRKFANSNHLCFIRLPMETVRSSSDFMGVPETPYWVQAAIDSSQGYYQGSVVVINDLNGERTDIMSTLRELLEYREIPNGTKLPDNVHFVVAMNKNGMTKCRRDPFEQIQDEIVYLQW